MAAVADRRPAVILAALRPVHLVAAAGAVLDRPQRLRHRIEYRSLGISIADRPDLRRSIIPADEAIVPWNAAIGVDAQHGASRIFRVLRAIHLSLIADGDEQRAVCSLQDTAAELDPCPALALHGEYPLDIVQSCLAAVADELRPRHCRSRAAAARFGVTEEDGAGSGKITCGQNIVQAAL